MKLTIEFWDEHHKHIICTEVSHYQEHESLLVALEKATERMRQRMLMLGEKTVREGAANEDRH